MGSFRCACCSLLVRVSGANIVPSKRLTVIASGALGAAKQSRICDVDSGLLRRQETPRNDEAMILQVTYRKLSSTVKFGKYRLDFCLGRITALGGITQATIDSFELLFRRLVEDIVQVSVNIRRNFGELVLRILQPGLDALQRFVEHCGFHGGHRSRDDIAGVLNSRPIRLLAVALEYV